ncbi:Serine/threonine-protein kinase B [Legionella massiliensis]|uniref:Serine/threonine-protein kinase B n=1 Tax=Legionella massiliensis TaxID=1034943 RepID=A0A078KST1_9GAMM|nr:pentapeptide repeat-containing protein [Legionella massiliensis]CDZ76126.1 Serine/threonine-protein kinase B [Legionella massiliensis]CEE11864.1 Serine/threonine-protein kinase B [Legionella massiliensis]
MKGYFLASLLVFSTTCFSHTYSNPTHMEQFKKTGVCENCDLSGINWLSTNKEGAIILSNSNLIRSSLDLLGSFNRQYSNFSNIVGLRLSMSYGDFSYSNFANADLRNAHLINNNFTSADFTSANLTGVNFSGTNLYKAKISQEQLNSVSELCNAVLPNGQESEC